MAIADWMLFQAAKRLYKSEVCHSAEMRQSLTSLAQYGEYRSERAESILEHGRRLGVSVRDKVVLDFGCADGAITPHYLRAGAREIIGVDVDEDAIARAQRMRSRDRLRFELSTPQGLPLPDDSIDVVISYDVFEHVTEVAKILEDLYRVVRPGGQVLIGTWGWYHPFAPHLFAAMPVPWSHVVFSEKTVLRACRRVYDAPWYVPTMHDLDKQGNKRLDKYLEEAIPLNYVNKLFVRDFERLFAASPFQWTTHPMPFGSRYARWTRIFLRIPWLREFVTGYLWVVLKKPCNQESPTQEAAALATSRH